MKATIVGVVFLSLAAVLQAETSFSYVSGTPPAACADKFTGSVKWRNYTFPTPAVCPVVYVPPPRVGQSFTDPVFGRRMRVIRDDGVINSYSNPSHLSATGKYAALDDYRNGGVVVVDALTGNEKKRIRECFFSSGAWWDPHDDDLIYCVTSKDSGHAVFRRRISDGSAALLFDPGTAIWTGGTGDNSTDNWIAYASYNPRKVPEDPSAAQVCAAPLDGSNKKYCAPIEQFGPAKAAKLDFLLLTDLDEESLKRYVVVLPWGIVTSVDLTGGRLNFEYLPPEHPESVRFNRGNGDGKCDPGELCVGGYMDHAGAMRVRRTDGKRVVYVFANFETDRYPGVGYANHAILYRLAAGEQNFMKEAVSVLAPTPWPNHPTCAKTAPVCLYSIGSGTAPNGEPVTVDQPPGIYRSELIAFEIKADLSAEVHRIAQHRSWDFGSREDDYWSMPKGGLSGDGRLAVATSNFGQPAATPRRVIVVDTGFGPAKVASNGVVNSATFEPKIAPGSYVTLLGTNFTDHGCSAAAETLPLPETLCGASVFFNNVQARLHYASAHQINAIFPQSLPPQQSVTISVSRTFDQSEPVDVPAGIVLSSAPGIFAYRLEDGVVRAVIQNSDWSMNGPLRADIQSRPLRRGEAGHLYANGLGPVDPPVPDGHPAPVEPLSRTTYQVELYINGVRQNVVFSGLAPAISALYQVDFLLDSNTPINGDHQDTVWLKVNGVESPHLVLSLTADG